MDDKLFNDIEKEIKESSSIDLEFPIEEEKKAPQNVVSLIIAVLTGILLACITFSLFLRGGEKTENTIPVFEKYEESFKEEANTVENISKEDTSIYDSTRSFDEEAQALIEKQEEDKAKEAKILAERKAKEAAEKAEAERKAKEAKLLEESKKVKTVEVPKKAPIKKVEEVKKVNKPIKIKTTNSNLWSIQLLSGASKNNVEKQWNTYRAAYPSLLAKQDHAIQEAIVNGKTFYRLRIVNIKDSKSARDLCGKLKNNQISCFVTK
ncbi:MAG: SPOR domain-containing protein [Alphaproteobacteria bacterium]|jgi:HD superfamily phosphohydrolase|nr:SPOR domain-containing protein [Alphaproteobacteria bacterium]